MDTEVFQSVWEIVGLLVGSTFIIQISPIKLNPWGWLFKKLSEDLNKDINEKLDTVTKKVDDLETKMGDMEAERAESHAKQNRRRILRFADECRREEKHSQEHFNEVIEGDIKAYQKYCRENPDFENDKCVMSIAFIEKAYEHCLKDNDFL